MRQKTLNGFISPLLLVLSYISIIPSSLYFPYFSLRGLNAYAPWTVVAQATPTEWTSTAWARNQWRPSSSVSMDRGCLPPAGVQCCTLRASLYSSPPPSLRSPPPLWAPLSLRPHFQNGVGVTAPQSSIMCFVVNSHRLPSLYRSVYLQFLASKCVSRSQLVRM